jgi:hypothetical protein
MNQAMDLGLDPSEQDILDEIGAQLRARGWAGFVTVAWLVRDWRILAQRASEYAFTVDDYTNDLTARDGLEIVLAGCPEPLRTKLKSAIEETDKKFLAGTQDDATRSLENYFRIGAGWWWRRIPRRGSLAEYLAARS